LGEVKTEVLKERQMADEPVDTIMPMLREMRGEMCEMHGECRA